MSELREAAQTVGAWAVECDGDLVGVYLTETAAKLVAENMHEANRGRDFVWRVVPLVRRTHPPRDEWRLASELPTESPIAAKCQRVEGSEDRGALGLTTYVLVGPKGVRYVGLHNSAEECWTVALGWPPESEIEEYKSNGFAVYPAMVTWQEPKK